MKFEAFKTHGVVFKEKSGNTQYYGHCPFCGKENKFFVNFLNLLWDCKHCNRNGNSYTFLSQISEQNQKDIEKEHWERLSRNRKLPVEALKLYPFGINGMKYTLPIYNENNKIHDVRIYSIGGKFLSTDGCQVGLLNINKLVQSKITVPVYLCEGEWDAIAMSWLLKVLGKPGIPIGVPGATTFKKEWIRFFKDRNVHVIYDNDEAGERGEKRVYDMLNGSVRGISFTHWHSSFESGFDLRDLITTTAVAKKKPKYCFKVLMSMVKPRPRSSFASESNVSLVNQGKSITSEKPVEVVNPPLKRTIQEVYDTIKKWLYVKDLRGVQVALASFVSNFIKGDPLWLFLVAPPGGSKTEILNTFSTCETAYLTSSLTPQALISGADFVHGQDPSLIPQLNEKILIVKDFTTILSKNEAEKEEIFGILRDAYDGKCGKVFGTGVKRVYDSHFTVIAGVTPVIHEISLYHQSLGERFIKFFLGDNLTHDCEEMIISRAISNLHQEIEMRTELTAIVKEFIDYKIYHFKDQPIPAIPDIIHKKLIALAQFGARMRGTVSRDRYSQDIIKSKPSAEVGSRLGKQLAKLAVSLAIVNDRKEVNEEDYAICRKAMLDTVSQRHEDIIRKMIQTLPTIYDTVTTKSIAEMTRYTVSTISRILSDMNMLGIVRKSGEMNRFDWTVSEYMRFLIQKAELYKIKEESERKSVYPIKVLKIRKRRRVSSIKLHGDRVK